jgi:hypothetical protein
MADDLANLVGAIGAAGIDVSDVSDVVFVTTPRAATVIETSVGALFDNLVLPSLGVPAKTIIAFAPAAIASGYSDPPTFETAREPSFVFSDRGTEIVNASGTSGAPTRNLFQEALTGVRVRGRCAWSVLPGGAQFVQNINW